MKISARCPRCGGNLSPSIEDGPGVWGCLLCSRTFVYARQSPTGHAPAVETQRAA